MTTNRLWKEVGKGNQEVRPWHMEVTREGVGNVIGRAGNIVEAWDVSVDALVYAKEP